MTYSRPPMSYTPSVATDENGQEFYSEGTVIIGTTGATADPNTYEDPETGELQQVEEVEPDAEDLDDPNYVPEEVDLANITEEIHAETVIPDPELADSIACYELGNTPADITVQYLSTRCFSGDMTAEEAFTEALASGISHRQLMSSFKKLKNAFPKS